MNNETIITVNDITKEYQLNEHVKVKAMSQVNISIKKGEFVAIIGRSGSGKSTLMHIMSGLCKPTSGQVIIKKEDISTYTDAKIAHFRNKEMGFVFQTFHLEPAYTAWENVALPLIPQKIKKKERKKRAIEALLEVNMEHRADHKINQLSGGEMQRVCIARAIVNKPDIIFADEPTGNLDKENGAVVMALLRKIVENGSTVVMVTHNEADARLCDRTIELEDGKVINR